MRKKLKVLIVEDNANDAELLLLELRRVGFELEWQRVDTAAGYVKCLSGDLDLILSDYEMPQFNGLHALELLKESGLTVPFIIISGTIGEDTAVAAMKQGAADYLLKDRLARLEQSINQALDQSRLRLEREEAVRSMRESEQRLRNIFDGISAFIGLFSLDGRVIELNQAALQTAAIRRADMVGRHISEGPWWAHSKEMQQRVSAAIVSAAKGQPVKDELTAEIAGGGSILIEASFNPLKDISGRITQGVVSGIDISVRKNAERKNQEQLDELLRWQDVVLNREDRVQALKAEVNDLLVQQALPERYSNPQLV